MTGSNDAIFLDGIDFPALVQRYLAEHVSTLKPGTAVQYDYFLTETLKHTKGSMLALGRSDLRESRRTLKEMLEPSRVRQPVKFKRWKAV